MDLSFLRPLYARPGPFACVYLDAPGDGDGRPATTVGWTHLRDELAAEGADVATLGALGHGMPPDDSALTGRGMALFAAHGRLALAEPLAERPGRDRGTVTFVPDAMPLALQHAPDIPYTAVQVRRVHEPDGASRLVAETQTGRWPLARAAPPEPDVRQASAGEWRQEAQALAAVLAAEADHAGSEVVVMSGDRWACSVLYDTLPPRLREDVMRIDVVAEPAEPGRLLFETELGHLLDGRLSSRDRQHLDRFLEERARRGGAVEGLAATTQALRGGAVAVLLVDTPSELDREQLWVGAATSRVGVDREELRPLDASACWSAPADAAVLRALVGAGGELVAMPRGELPLTDGVGALLHDRSPERAA
ncbi:baeRF2 domain-containing protein [Streptacidiphilus melanogenes]|uniref:baeRF2 domain-containing protein n=1 Tax=Streptacidiphilus melanogenes TaxID=411235 RepID=UPI0005A9367D|nr:hypothetical protein [Streptacidiphilus melanogenes]